jgi:hypothetical protein
VLVPVPQPPEWHALGLPGPAASAAETSGCCLCPWSPAVFVVEIYLPGFESVGHLALLEARYPMVFQVRSVAVAAVAVVEASVLVVPMKSRYQLMNIQLPLLLPLASDWPAVTSDVVVAPAAVF